jgi:SNF2 family DNA or RNA helicase
MFQSAHYQLVVLDEAQVIKNAQSQISCACKALQASMRLAITGTPIENRWDELWSIFQFVQPQVLGGKAEMQRALSNPHSTAKLAKRLSPFIRRRTKAEVALDLPEKLEQTVFVEMASTERAFYDELIRKTRQGVLKKVEEEGAASHRMEILEAILRLRQCCVHPSLVSPEVKESSKLERVMADLQEVVDEGRKVLVYSQFTQMLRHIESQVQEKGWKYVYLDGSTEQREEVVQQFQQDPEISIFLISLKAGGVGLNLTAADYVFLYDPWWNVAVENQAIDRAHRLGRKSTVIARRYIMALSIEEKMMTLKQHKSNLSRALFDALPEENPSLNELIELLS